MPSCLWHASLPWNDDVTVDVAEEVALDVFELVIEVVAVVVGGSVVTVVDADEVAELVTDVVAVV